MSYCRSIAYIIVLCSFCSCSNKINKTGSVQQQKFIKIDSFLNAQLDVQKIPGIAIAITSGDRIIYKKGFGVTNISTRKPLEPFHNFHIASISKTFTATAVMQLAERGKIDIDKTLTTYLPYFRMTDERYKVITIKQMLNHTSGMPDVDDYELDKKIII